MDYLLAQVNIARMREPLESPRLADFVAALDPVNAVADAAPGFVWRLQTEDGNATAVHAFEWDRAGSAGVLVNMSVWESVEALAAYERTLLSANSPFDRWRYGNEAEAMSPEAARGFVGGFFGGAAADGYENRKNQTRGACNLEHE